MPRLLRYFLHVWSLIGWASGGGPKIHQSRMSDREVSPSQTTRDYCHLLEIQKSKNSLSALLSTGHRRWHNLNATWILRLFTRILHSQQWATLHMRFCATMKWSEEQTEIPRKRWRFFVLLLNRQFSNKLGPSFWLNGFARHVIREYTHKAEPKGWQPPVNTFFTKSFITNFRNCAPGHLAFQGWESEAEYKLY